MRRSGALARGPNSGGKLSVNEASGERRYVRVSRDAISGEEHWIVADVVSSTQMQMGKTGTTHT